MEIKRFKAEGIPYALSFAKMVYNHSLRARQPEQAYNVFFDEYMNEEAIAVQVDSGQLIVWAATVNNEVLGVSAMTREGHITMLYVNPNYEGHKIATRLLDTMKEEATSVLGLKWLTVNATPACTGPYFMRHGFKATDFSQGYESPYMSLACKCAGVKKYKTRKFSWLITIVTVVIFALLILASTFGYIFYYLITH